MSCSVGCVADDMTRRVPCAVCGSDSCIKGTDSRNSATKGTDNCMKGTDSRNSATKGTDNCMKGTDNRNSATKGTDNCMKGTDNRNNGADLTPLGRHKHPAVEGARERDAWRRAPPVAYCLSHVACCLLCKRDTGRPAPATINHQPSTQAWPPGDADRSTWRAAAPCTARGATSPSHSPHESPAGSHRNGRSHTRLEAKG